MHNGVNSNLFCVNGKAIIVAGHFPKVARLRSEYFVVLDEPEMFLDKLKEAKVKADVFTFVQQLSDREPRHSYSLGWDKMAVLRIGTYDQWWKNQINDKTRNMVRKAAKKGVLVQPAKFNTELAKGIYDICNETPVRQGRPFKHYGKDMQTVEAENATFLNQSDFIGAFLNGELIGYAKLVHLEGASVLMQIISKIVHWDKAPTNALLAKAVEICAARNVSQLFYGRWSRRTLGDFKKHHGFECLEVPRFFVPLSLCGRLALGLHLHQPVLEAGLEKIPENWLRYFANLRGKWYSFRYRKQLP